MLTQDPLPKQFVEEFADKIQTTEPNGREVFIIGNGAWINFSEERSKKWLREMEEIVEKRLPFFTHPVYNERIPKLFITPSAQGFRKPAIFTQEQNNLGIMRMELEMAGWTQENGYDHLGTYNMSAQASSPDGTHASMETNLMKAMMVLNWLNTLDPMQIW